MPKRGAQCPRRALHRHSQTRHVCLSAQSQSVPQCEGKPLSTLAVLVPRGMHQASRPRNGLSEYQSGLRPLAHCSSIQQATSGVRTRRMRMQPPPIRHAANPPSHKSAPRPRCPRGQPLPWLTGRRRSHAPPYPRPVQCRRVNSRYVSFALRGVHPTQTFDRVNP